MNRNEGFASVLVAALVILAVGFAASVGGVPTSSTLTYQGFLTNPNGAPRNGSFQMRFVLYNAAVAGTALWDSGNLNVNVDDGLFSVDLGVDLADFDGQARWLSLTVAGQLLSPRQELRPAPVAMTLVPGGRITGAPRGSSEAILGVTLSGFWPAAQSIAGFAPATGTAVYAAGAGGVGLFSTSTQSYGVWGRSTDSWGGYFTSNNGYGLRVSTSGSDHYDHGAYITSQAGYGVYAQSASNMAVRGEAGDVSGILTPLGPVGVVGIGSSRGVYGSSGSGIGAYAYSGSNYGAWGQSNDYRGVTGRTNRPDNNYGLYTPNNLYSLNINLGGAIAQVVQNGGDASLEPGDVVVFAGMAASLEEGGPPVIRVRKAETARSSAVAGVVQSRFNPVSVHPELEQQVLAELEALEQESAPDVRKLSSLRAQLQPVLPGKVPPGAFLLVVVHGPAQVKAAAFGSTAIEPGDLLTSGLTAGHAAKVEALDDGEASRPLAPGATLGKALGRLEPGEDSLWVFVTLQ